MEKTHRQMSGASTTKNNLKTMSEIHQHKNIEKHDLKTTPKS
jgi:hypothetical protein